jgi:hypothetical protein
MATATAVSLARLDAREQRLRLRRGRLDLRVPKLEPGRAVVVETPDAEVRVIGTHFTVEIVPRAGTSGSITRVAVMVGIVQVRQATSVRLLHPGERWSSSPEPIEGARLGSSENSDEAKPDVAGPVNPAAQAAAGVQAPSAPESAKATSNAAELAEQNRLLQAAVEARNQGNDALVVRRTDELFRQYPRSPLAESARVERFRALRRLGRHAEAARDAQRYLAEYGQGFARDEARDVALSVAPQQKP